MVLEMNRVECITGSQVKGFTGEKQYEPPTTSHVTTNVTTCTSLDANGSIFISFRGSFDFLERILVKWIFSPSV
jgi:hypothetical protein